MNVPSRVEEVVLPTSAGVLDVSGDAFGSALRVRGNLVALDAADGEGSLGRFSSVTASEELRRLARDAAAGFLETQSLAAQAAPFVRLFVPGRYRLSLLDLDRSYHLVPQDWETGKEMGYEWYYQPEWNTLVATQPRSSLSEDVVEIYLQRIERGERPTILVASQQHHPVRFLLDGHHKHEAYLYAGIAPRLLEVTRLDPDPMPLPAPPFRPEDIAARSP